MSVLRNFEDRVAGLVEGTFGRIFRTQVRPVELARKLAREMDEHKTVSLSRTYAPHEYAIWLSPEDRGRLEGVEREVADELAAYLLEHARRERIALRARPAISFRTDERLSLGEFGIQALAPQDEPPPAAPAPPAPAASAASAASAAAPRAHGAPSERAEAGQAILIAEGKRIGIGSAGAAIGRSRDCDVVLADANVSRHHAEIRPTGDGGWTIADLGSTNGVRLNGRVLAAHVPTALHAGDRLEIGTLDAGFEIR